MRETSSNSELGDSPSPTGIEGTSGTTPNHTLPVAPLRDGCARCGEAVEGKKACIIPECPVDRLRAGAERLAALSEAPLKPGALLNDPVLGNLIYKGSGDTLPVGEEGGQWLELLAEYKMDDAVGYVQTAALPTDRGTVLTYVTRMDGKIERTCTQHAPGCKIAAPCVCQPTTIRDVITPVTEATDMKSNIVETSAAPMPVKEKWRSNYVPAPAFFKLNHACKLINDAFTGGFGCYLVGSSLNKRDYRDVDVRLILEDAEYKRLFHSTASGWTNPLWSLLCVTLSEWLSRETGLPIDFQIQTQSHANENWSGKEHKRNPLGIFLDYPSDRPTEAGKG